MIAASLNIAIASIAVLTAPAEVYSDFYFDRIPERLGPKFDTGIAEPRPVGIDFPGCFGLPPGVFGQPQPEEAGSASSFRVRCFSGSDHPGSGRTTSVREIASRFASSPNWELLQQRPGVRNLPPGLHSFIWIGLLLMPSFWFLTRPLKIDEDILRAWSAVRKHPWILLVPTAAVMSFNAVAGPIFPPAMSKVEDSIALFSALKPSIWLVALVFPVLEEAIFRHWLYIRLVGRFPIWLVALASSWAFMLVHILNPQALAMPTYLPTIFILGLVLFWVRHRSSLLTLATICHVIHNALVLGLS